MDSNELMNAVKDSMKEEDAREFHLELIGVRAELKRIEAKKILRMKLTEEEGSMWTLYGSAGGRKW